MEMTNDNGTPMVATDKERAATRQVAIIVLAAWGVLFGIRRGFRNLVPGS